MRPERPGSGDEIGEAPEGRLPDRCWKLGNAVCAGRDEFPDVAPMVSGGFSPVVQRAA